MGTANPLSNAQRELHDLRVEEWSDLALGAVSIGLSLVATHFAPQLTIPLFLGGLAVAALGCRAYFRRWDLVERLLLDSNAYEIAEVHVRAERVATLESRALLARSIRWMLANPDRYQASRVALVADELAALADELEDERLSLDPVRAVRCRLLLTDGVESPLLNPAVPSDGLRIQLRLIRAGFEERK